MKTNEWFMIAFTVIYIVAMIAYVAISQIDRSKEIKIREEKRDAEQAKIDEISKKHTQLYEQTMKNLKETGERLDAYKLVLQEQIKQADLKLKALTTDKI